jgi:hypothetical protein
MNYRLTKTKATLTAQLATLAEQVRRLTATTAPTLGPNAHIPGPAPWAQQRCGRGRGAGHRQDTQPYNGDY